MLTLKEIKPLLIERNIRPSKRLGQNFLVDKNIQRKIIAACEFDSSDTVLEIGAGRGELTRLIAAKARRVWALEIDKDLLPVLEENLEDITNVKVISGDILRFNFRQIKSKVKAFGNIPYYITTSIIEHLLKYRDLIDVVFLTVQKEFAKRITALPGSKDYGSFSCFAQYYTQPKILFTIHKGSFRPQPKVDSCFLRLEIRRKPAVKVENEKSLFKIIRASFNQRRKTLRNSLKGIIPLPKLQLFFNRYHIDPNIRPEALALQDFANLANL